MPIRLSDSKVQNVETLGLIDSGAGGKFIDQNYAKTSGFEIFKLDSPLRAFNVDGTENKKGTIKTYVKLDLEINGRKNTTELLVTGLGKERIILGFPWLNENNPDINWRSGQFTWREEKRRFFPTPPVWIRNRENMHPMELARKLARQAIGIKRITPKPTVTEEEDEEEPRNRSMNPLSDDEPSILVPLLDLENEFAEIWLNTKTTTSNEFHMKHDEKKKDLPIEEQIPPEYHDYLDLFDEVKAARFPKSRVWDHKIEMKPGFEPKSFKTYNLTPEEQIELDKFLKDNLEKGCIRPSQSPMASPFFYIGKKDSGL